MLGTCNHHSNDLEPAPRNREYRHSLCLWHQVPHHRQCHTAKLYQVRRLLILWFLNLFSVGMLSMTLSYGNTSTPPSTWLPILTKFRKIYAGEAYKFYRQRYIRIHFNICMIQSQIINYSLAPVRLLGLEVSQPIICQLHLLSVVLFM